MRVETLTIGDELLDGRVTDTNTVRLAQALSQVGLHLQQRTSITDDSAVIIREAQACAARGTAICVVSGGLGPTADDVTAAAFAQLCDVSLQQDAQQAQKITNLLLQRGRQVGPNQLKQAARPQGAELLDNPVGMAPGFGITYGTCRFIALPGIPAEFDALVDSAVIAPLLQQKPVLRQTFYCFGLMEAVVDQRLKELPELYPAVRLQFQVKFPEIHVSLHAPPEQALALQAAATHVRGALGDYVYASDTTHNRQANFAATLLALCAARQVTLAVAESCTGGLLADLLTDVPGASATLLLGVVAYSNAAKQSLLQVQASTLAQHGAVSEATVLEMAQGVRLAAGSTYGLSTSGIAGPGGGSAEKPVGTVWLGLAGPAGRFVKQLRLPVGRRHHKQMAAYHVLDLLRRQLLEA